MKMGIHSVYLLFLLIVASLNAFPDPLTEEAAPQGVLQPAETERGKNPEPVSSGPVLFNTVLDFVSSYGSCRLLPCNNWASGDWDAFSDSLWGYNTPRINQLSVEMNQTATTIYEGGFFFKKLNLGLGAALKTDNNMIGTINQFMGLINFRDYEIRVEYSRLKGTARWLGDPISGMSDSSTFDNQLLHIDLLHYFYNLSELYLGIGYSSYQLPVQIDCLIWDGYSVWWAPVVSFYQPDMKFQIYSFLFGFDTLHDALYQRSQMGKQIPGFFLWVWTQDRFGLGMSTLSGQIVPVIEEANNLSLWSKDHLAMLVDYNLTMGIQYVQHYGRFHVGLGLGYNIGGQTISCISLKGPVQSDFVEASPSVYLVHHGVMIQGSLRF